MIKTPLSTVIGGAFWTPGATVIGGSTPNFDQQIQKLFANNEQGFAYDPNDLSTMFQGVSDTVPVTGAGQTVGLMLDKSKNLFKQKLTVSEPSSWAKSSLATVEGNKITLTGAGGVVLPHNTPRGQLLHARIKYTKTPEVALGFNDTGSITSGSLIATTTESSGEMSVLFYPKTDGIYIRLASEGEFTLDSITLEVVEGNHAYQTTSSSRPILRKNAVTGANYLEFDKVDDKLITNLPEQLIGCTVVRSVPSVGTQILTGQTIPVTHEDNTDHCGLIVINRVLTPSETSAITTEFNKRAGV